MFLTTTTKGEHMNGALISAGNVPEPFPGNAEQKMLNHLSHGYYGEDTDWRCCICDSKVGSTSYDWPCGFRGIPRRELYRWVTA